jgi:ABC-type antimicrobial peptide transport system permease subunit
MIKNYLTTAFRNLSRHRVQSIVNISGLVVSIAAFLLLYLIIRYESSFDDFHKNKNSIYRVVRIGKNPVNREYRTGVPFPVTFALRKDFPQLANTAAICADNDVQVQITGSDGTVIKKFKEKTGVFIAEPQFFQIFDFALDAGDPKSALKEPNTVLLTSDVAEKYFGETNAAIGKTLKIDGILVKVTGILHRLPDNTDFPLKAVISYVTLKNYANLDNWMNISDNNYCFVQLEKNGSPGAFGKLLDQFTETHIKPVNPGYTLSPQPLSEIHYDERYGNFNGRTFSRDLILALVLIGVFLLIIACVNFINLSTAQAMNRSREVGVRKVLGGKRLELILQFLGETGITSLLAFIFALFIVLACLPLVNTILDIHLSPSHLFSLSSLMAMLGILIMVTFLSGFYPAMVLSGFKPAIVLKSAIGPDNHKGVMFRRGLVVSQFVIAQALIVGTMVIAFQMDYFSRADMGFRKNAIVNAGIPGDSLSLSRVDGVKQELEKIPGVEQISLSAFAPSSVGGWFTDLRTGENTSKQADMVVCMKLADTAFFRLYGLHLAAGRAYFPSDTVREYVVNETLVRKLGYRRPADAIGKEVNVNGKLFPIVGVVKDFHESSLRDPISNIVMTTWKSQYGLANVKIDLHKAKEVLASMEAVWNKNFPDYVFEYHFLDQSIAEYYISENQLSLLYKIFSAIAIFVSCLGLYGLVSFLAVQRKKEIGIRKVLGAPVHDILIMLSKEFTILITIAFLIAAPIAWYFMSRWLEQYTYRIVLSIWFFVATIFFSLCVAWLTVGYTAVKAARANPVNSLRSE